jgi:Zn finger protein HypA/HybF involved in hydrogenase expression
MMNEYWDDDEILQCYNYCDWRGTVAELDNPEEDVYRCPKCGGSTAMIMSAPTPAREGE